jgi:hypothetical protein
MPTSLLIALVAVVVVGLVVRSLVGHYRRQRAQKAELEQLGFQPCPDRKAWLEETVTRIENTRGFNYEVKDSKHIPGEAAIYHYVKLRHRYHDEPAMTEEELLFPVTRPSAAGLILTIKPSSLAPGIATRLMGAIATGPWDVQPDDLTRIAIPPDLKDTNLIAALGPSGASLYDLVGPDTISVMQGLGDAGGALVRFRDSWCCVAGTSAQIPFRVNELIGRMRPLL